ARRARAVGPLRDFGTGNCHTEGGGLRLRVCRYPPGPRSGPDRATAPRRTGPAPDQHSRQWRTPAVPIATPEVYAEMLGRAKENTFAYPAINCTSSETINAAIRGFAEAGSDGIIQFSTGGSEFGSGLGVKDMVTGAVALAEFAHVVAAKYDVNIAL